MPKRETEPLSRRFHIMLFEADLRWLQDNYSVKHDSVGVAKIVRKMVRHCIKKIQEKQSTQSLPLPKLPEDFKLPEEEHTDG